MSEGKEFRLSNAYVMPVDELGLPLPGVAPQPVGEATLMTVSMEDIRDVLAHTEVVETEGMDLIASPGQMWLVDKGQRQTITWEVTLSEEQFWLIVATVYGLGVVREMKQDFDDMLRWEGEGGSCAS